ncbi:MAG: hypothetical protein R2731_03995 [Nocardioides sp.]
MSPAPTASTRSTSSSTRAPGWSRPTIAVATPAYLRDGDTDVHELLLSNFFAKTRALAFGKTEDEVRAEGTAEGIVRPASSPGTVRPPSIMAPALTPSVLGQLIALYEHVTFTQGAVWGIDSFDQWGRARQAARRPDRAGRRRGHRGPRRSGSVHARADRLLPLPPAGGGSWRYNPPCAIRRTAGFLASRDRAAWCSSASRATCPARRSCRPSTTWPTAACCRQGLAGGLRPSRLGGPGLRPDRARLGPRARAHRVP